MTNTSPLAQLEEAQKLTADAIVDLFQVTLKGAPSSTIIYFKDGYSAKWQGNVYQGMACRLNGTKRSTKGEASRPTLIMFNPAGVFNSFAFQGYFEGSQVVHRRVLRQHLEGDVNIFDIRYWIISRVYGVTAGQSISFELRGAADGPSMTIPARQYIPDAGFPYVTI